MGNLGDLLLDGTVIVIDLLDTVLLGSVKESCDHGQQGHDQANLKEQTLFVLKICLR